MAKWGEGDPRWIVEERPDATNVNNWHWTEKNADSWSKTKLKELFTKLEFEDPTIGAKVVIEEVEKCEGEARANNRKAKLIFFYEWVLTLKWKGFIAGKEPVSGKVEIPNLSEEHSDMNDVDLDVSVDNTKVPEAEILKEMMRKGLGAQKVRETLGAYVSALKSEFSVGLILPNKDNGTIPKPPSSVPTTTPKPKQPTKTTAAADANKSMKNLGIGCKIELEDIVGIEETFKCTSQEIFNALTRKDMLRVFAGGDVKMSEEEAGKGVTFEMLGGNIQGEFLEIVPFTKIVQKWRLKSWPPGLYSNVEIIITQKKEDTTVNLTQTGVPIKEVENTKSGWNRYYWDSIKRCFGYGAVLF